MTRRPHRLGQPYRSCLQHLRFAASPVEKITIGWQRRHAYLFLKGQTDA